MSETKRTTFDRSDLRVLTREDLDALEIGAGILGTGGGGNPYQGKLLALQAMNDGYELSILAPDRIAQEAVCMPVGGIGAPVVGVERIREGREGLRCLRAMEELLRAPIDAVVCEEIGGANSMSPLVAAGLAGLPVLDCDGMGRAFPEMQMTTFSIYGHSSTPSVMCDLHGNVVTFTHAASEVWHERMARACVVAQGGGAMLAAAPMSARFLCRYAVPDSYTRAIALGEAVMTARRRQEDPIAALCAHQTGRQVFTGKITDLRRHLRAGFAVGELTLTGFGNHHGESAEVKIQNENLVFAREGIVEVSVPDLIVILDIDSGHAITTEMLRYGQRVSVVALPAPQLLRSEEALAVVGPSAFGYPDIAYVPLEPAA
ncbi:DUF917 domain-containing protein [Pararhizobium mangrovi]|uniref:DUF917 domain-containing protein n=1 Tax=Pararhizobium mangrovi TaxID=2590452 RepID=A0A506UFX9_9HYPH|nr:DUF917 domain-containing protein [Pararhizobium mangrovi]TPW31985.1 DUF917 domain-containing protein [Pararhizobium mangrovi]